MIAEVTCQVSEDVDEPDADSCHRFCQGEGWQSPEWRRPGIGGQTSEAKAQHYECERLARYRGNSQKNRGSDHTADRMPLVPAGAIGCVPGADDADEAAEIVEPAVRQRRLIGTTRE